MLKLKSWRFDINKFEHISFYQFLSENFGMSDKEIQEYFKDFITEKEGENE